MKTFEEFDFFKNKSDEEISYSESEPDTLLKISEREGGLKNIFDICRYLNDTYADKNVKINDKIHEIKKTIILLEYENGFIVECRFYTGESSFVGISENTELRILTKRKITEADPFGEESWY